MNLKVDEYGNILWGFRTFYPFTGMGTDLQNNLYFGGWFENDSVFFGPFKAKGNSGDAFVGKTFDYSIFRGPVKSGPYCAGDTFKVPYTKMGEYADTNTFFAELSDEYGEFTGKERILGSKRTKDSGTIIGTLPLFEVASSGKYRIRIRSTSPQAQSFYKIDTLRLLIYSRDKANPGPTESICRGDTITIKTFGGTKWTWSPKYRMSDSTSRTPLVWPDKTTQYRIIIADSSGCGEADTAFKTVVVRKDQKIIFVTPPDTIVCKGSTVPVIASFNYGDSLGYKWDWYAISPQGNFTFLKSGYGKLKDTLNYKMSITEKDSQQLLIFLQDGCGNKTDVAFYTIRVTKVKPKAVFRGNDTAEVCPGKPINVVVDFSKGNMAGYNWQWYELNTFSQWIPGVKGSGYVSDTLSYILPLNWKKNKLLKIILNDNCSPLPDTATYTIVPRDTLQISLNTHDTLLCKGRAHTWKAKGNGGDKNGYAFKWINRLNGQILSNSDSLTLVADSMLKVTVELDDACMPQTISTSFTLNVKPPLQVEITDKNKNGASDTTLCHGQVLSLYSKASGGNGVYNYTWLLTGKQVSVSDSVSVNLRDYLPASGASTQLLLVLKDQCTFRSDTSIMNVTMLPELKVQGTVTDSICLQGKAVFHAQGVGGNGKYSFTWTDSNNNIQSKSDSLIIDYINPLQAGRIKRYVEIEDGCTSPGDKIMLTTVFRNMLSLSLRTTDTCPVNYTVIYADMSGGKGYNYKVSWWKENTFLNTNSGTQTVFPDNPWVQYKAVVNDGCSPASDTASINIGLRPVLKLKVRGFCFGDTTFVTTTTIGSLKVSILNWQINNKDIVWTDSLLNRIMPSTGSYKLKVSATNQSCQGSDSIYFPIVEKPDANFEYAHFNRDANGIPFHFINTSAKSNTWLWTFNNSDTSGQHSPDYTFSDTGFATVKLVASNLGLCFDSLEMLIPVLEKIEFFFPDVFSPDGNGINDGFGLNPNQYRLVKDFHLEIYNRWGEKVFETNDVNEHWLGSEYQQGIYIYKASIRDIYNILHEDIKGVVGVFK